MLFFILENGLTVALLKQCLNFHWLIAGLALNRSLREDISLYRAVSHREEERNEIWWAKKKKKETTLPAPIGGTIGPCPTSIHISRTPGTEISQHRRPLHPQYILMMSGRIQRQT